MGFCNKVVQTPNLVYFLDLSRKYYIIHFLTIDLNVCTETVNDLINKFAVGPLPVYLGVYYYGGSVVISILRRNIYGQGSLYGQKSILFAAFISIQDQVVHVNLTFSSALLMSITDKYDLGIFYFHLNNSQ